ncbi:MAG: choice-of-anchor L domain-containing protein [Flavobacteriales bacterium]|nr:choice-of-anchor L domain-containing protein [Flavobacteriales bacterium]
MNRIQFGAIALILSTAVCSPAIIHAQLEVETGLTLEEYVNDILLGNGIQAFNITYQGGDNQLGYLTGGDDVFSISSGLILSCDVAENLECPDEFLACDGCLGNGFSDPDLLDIANSVPDLIGESFSVSSVNDGCVLEFDFIAAGDTVSFDYVFGSDEYETWINTQYNDVFAFFLSGPGITGIYDSPAGFPDGSVNIAGVPNTDPNLPITISSVNSGTNPEYYVDNQGGTDVCINGYTVPFTASYPVECGETYHIKLAIADGSDTALESIVVLEEGSFESNAVVQIDLSIDVGGPEANTIYEDCGTATLSFERPVETILDIQEMVYINYGSSVATNGVDYGQPQPDGTLLPLPDSVVFAPYVSIVEFELTAAIDGVVEGPELVEMEIENVAACNGGGLTTYFSFYVAEEPPPFEVNGYDTEVCLGDAIELAPLVSGGYGNYTYEWLCNGEEGAPFLFDPDVAGPWSCEIIVGDTCGMPSESAIIEVEVLQFDPLSVAIDPDAVVLDCNAIVDLQANATGGYDSAAGGFYEYDWEDQDGNNLFASWFDPSILSLSTWQNADEIFLTVTDACGMEATDSVEVTYNIPALVVTVDEEINVLCNDPFSITASATGEGPFNYTWLDGGAWLGWGNPLNWSTSSDESIVLEVSDACGQVEAVDIEILVDAPDVIVSLPDGLMGPCTEVFNLQADVTSGSGGYQFSWFQNGINMSENGDNIDVQLSETTTFTVNVDDGCGQSGSDNAQIVIDNPPLVIELGPDLYQSCIDYTDLEVDVISGAGDYQYNWFVGGEPYDDDDEITLQSYSTISVGVHVQDGCGGSTNDSLVYHIPDIPILLDVTPSTTICAGDGIWLEAMAMGGEEGFVYYWPSLGTYGPTQYIAPTQSATYPVVATDICGDEMDLASTIEVQYLFSDFTVSGTEDNENRYTFRATPNPPEPYEGAYAYEWNFGDGVTSDDPIVVHEFDGLSDYTVTLDVTSWVGCTNQSYTVVRGPVLLYVPTAFTPNNDGINDAFKVVGGQIKDYELWIINRWGEEVFHSTSLDDFWMGDVQGGSHYAENGIYNWIIRLKGFNTDAEEYTGTLQLMR